VSIVASLLARSRFDVPVNKFHGHITGITGGVIDKSLNSTSALYESFETIHMHLDALGRTGSDLFTCNLLAITTSCWRRN
jgi:hypothetical protein